MKLLTKRILKTVIFLFLSVFMFLSIINAPWVFVSSKTTETDYSNWMNENLEEEIKVVNIAMIGAHDAFSADIDIWSDVDNKSSDGLMQGTVGKFIKGFSIRQSKTQVTGPKELLESGVRYFDMRISYNEKDNSYYTVHNYFSSPVEEVLLEISNFLKQNPGEFIIIDLQHVYGVNYDNQEDFNAIYELFLNSGIIDFAYQNNLKNLEDIDYGDITKNQSESGLLIFSKFKTDNLFFWDYDKNIRSSWANEDELDQIIDFLILESEYIKENQDVKSKLRIMQAVATMEMSVSGVLRSFQDWSLLARARDLNLNLLEYENLKELLIDMPIMMIDYSSDILIIDKAMEVIIDFNKSYI